MIPAKPLFANARQAWQRRPAAERLRLSIGTGISLTLVGYLLAQQIDFAKMINAELWNAPSQYEASLLTDLPPVTTMTADTWRQGALRHSLVLDRLEASDDGWRLVGRADNLDAFEHFSAWAAQRGWWALDWTLARDDEAGLAVEVRFVAQLEREPMAALEEATP
ncbi:hypothetical protein [Modicisalibacter luteus]|uniref:Type II secretion system protein M n=1 Tax=Modicisalibacter luteus TaxID=453962 RepID=A0ABV7LXB7_9GAMM|nr:hypothetical protein [Halomonas lutea]GHB06553.1 hypothetical protein GCM10007159_30650 [Halomonas lutea]